jgi:hypothetical protein
MSHLRNVNIGCNKNMPGDRKITGMQFCLAYRLHPIITAEDLVTQLFLRILHTLHA